MSVPYFLSNALVLACSVLLAYKSGRGRARNRRLLFSIEFGIWFYFFFIIFIFMTLGALPAAAGLGNARLLRREIVTVILGVAGTAGIVLMRAQAWSLASEARAASRSFVRLSKSRLAVFSLLVIALLLGTGLSKAIRYPPHVNDVLAYHLQATVHWHQEGWMPVTIPYGGNPHFENVNREFLGSSLLNLWAFWFFNNIVIIALPDVIFSACLLLALYRILRFLAVRAPLALFFSAAIMSTPAVLIHMDACKNYTSYIYPWVSLSFLLAENVAGMDWRRLLPGAVPFAIAWSSKIVSTFALPLTFGIFLAVHFGLTGVRNARREAGGFTRFTALCLALAFSVSWFWVYRNYANDGTYFMRIKEQSWAFSVSGKTNKLENAPFEDRFEGFPLSKNIRIFLGNLLAYPSRVQDPAVRGDTYELDGRSASNFGLVYYAFGQVFLLFYVLVFAGRRRRTRRRAALLFLVIAAFTVLMAHWAVYLNPYSYRSHLFWPLMLLPVALYAMRVLISSRVRGVFVALIAGAIFFHWMTTLYDAHRTTDRRRKITENLPLMNRPVALYWHWGLTEIGIFSFGDDVTIGFFVPEEGSMFPLYDTSLKRRIVCMPHAAADDRDLFWRFVTDQGVDVVYTSDGSCVEEAPLRIVKIPGTRHFFWVSRDVRALPQSASGKDAGEALSKPQTFNNGGDHAR